MDAMAKITWTKYTHNPLAALAPQAGTWRADASMTVDLLLQGDRYLNFYVGKAGGKDSIGVAWSVVDRFDGTTWNDYPANPVLSPGEPGSYDSRHIVDPASVEWGGKIYLYFSALGDGPDSLGLAISEDGMHFTKLEKPVLVGRAPEVVKAGDTLYLFYSMESSKGGYEFHLATSKDGLNFTAEGPVFSPEPASWDSLSVVTPRIFSADDIYVMFYAGDDKEKDYPLNFGIAFSDDLRNWKRYPGNPVFSCGVPGSWESRAIWYPEVLKLGDTYYLWYEGNDGKQSQVGLATSKSPIVEIGRTLLNH
jgi:predicted GH43/DUF377 family glycosyl hydrolase